MFYSQDHPAVFSALVGLIVLVMTAVGLSLLVDRRFQFSSGSRQMEKDFAADALVLETLRDRHDRHTRTLESQTGRETQASYGEWMEKTEELEKATADLSVLSAELAAEIASLEEEFREYRAEYRRTTWAAAEGEILGNLRLRGGKEYRDAKIKRVSTVGLEILHADGLARIQGPDLDRALQDRFQWDAEERHLALARERENRSLVTRAESSGTAPTAKPARQPAPVHADLGSLRFRVRAWRAKVDVLSAQTAEADSNASLGGRISVPGSLETWQARAGRLRNELERAGMELSVARSRLSAVAPGDPMLVDD